MKQTIVIISVSMLFILAACQQNPETKTAEAAPQDSITMDGAIVGNLIIESFVANYKGTIDNQYPITLEFIKFTSSVGGSYQYDGKTRLQSEQL